MSKEKDTIIRLPFLVQDKEKHEKYVVRMSVNTLTYIIDLFRTPTGDDKRIGSKKDF